MFPEQTQHLLSIDSLSRDDIRRIFDVSDCMSAELRRNRCPDTLRGKIVATLFFQASTRTRLSFESAALRLGAQILSFGDPELTRAGSGWKESMPDTAAMLSAYADLAVLRHPCADALLSYAQASKIPTVNAGNGGDRKSEHPTQAQADRISRNAGR
jgi:aspartate carbamoyltransferase catalytic subunit